MLQVIGSRHPSKNVELHDMRQGFAAKGQCRLAAGCNSCSLSALAAALCFCVKL